MSAKRGGIWIVVQPLYWFQNVPSGEDEINRAQLFASGLRFACLFNQARNFVLKLL